MRMASLSYRLLQSWCMVTVYSIQLQNSVSEFYDELKFVIITGY